MRNRPYPVTFEEYSSRLVAEEIHLNKIARQTPSTDVLFSFNIITNRNGGPNYNVRNSNRQIHQSPKSNGQYFGRNGFSGNFSRSNNNYRPSSLVLAASIDRYKDLYKSPIMIPFSFQIHARSVVDLTILLQNAFMAETDQIPQGELMLLLLATIQSNHGSLVVVQQTISPMICRISPFNNPIMALKLPLWDKLLNHIIFKGPCRQGLYPIELPSSNSTSALLTKSSTASLWHNRLGPSFTRYIQAHQ